MVDPRTLVGTPFRYGGRGPDYFDCYGLVMAIHAERGIALPDYTSPASQGVIAAMMATQLNLWQEVPCMSGTVALIRIGRLISHCAYMLDETRMIHAFETTGGVTIEKIDGWKHRIVGFYQYVG